MRPNSLQDTTRTLYTPELIPGHRVGHTRTDRTEELDAKSFRPGHTLTALCWRTLCRSQSPMKGVYAAIAKLFKYRHGNCMIHFKFSARPLKFSSRDLRKVLVVSSWFGLSHKQIWDANLQSDDTKCICKLQKSVCEPQKVRTAVGMHQESPTMSTNMRSSAKKRSLETQKQ